MDRILNAIKKYKRTLRVSVETMAGENCDVKLLLKYNDTFRYKYPTSDMAEFCAPFDKCCDEVVDFIKVEEMLYKKEKPERFKLFEFVYVLYLNASRTWSYKAGWVRGKKGDQFKIKCINPDHSQIIEYHKLEHLFNCESDVKDYLTLQLQKFENKEVFLVRVNNCEGDVYCGDVNTRFAVSQVMFGSVESVDPLVGGVFKTRLVGKSLSEPWAIQCNVSDLYINKLEALIGLKNKIEEKAKDKKETNELLPVYIKTVNMIEMMKTEGYGNNNL